MQGRTQRFSVEFPDLPGCVTAGKTLDEARRFVREALALHLRGLAEDGDAVPAPSHLDAIVADPQYKDAVAFLVEAPARKSHAVPVTITIAEDLLAAVRAKSAELGMSQSGLFAAGVRQYLGLEPAVIGARAIDRKKARAARAASKARRRCR